MQPFRHSSVLRWTLIVLLSTTIRASDEDSESAQTDHHRVNFPRFFDVFSRPKPEAEKQSNVGLKHHIGNVLQGGSIGFSAEFNPLGKVHGVIDHAKQFIPFPDFTGPHTSDGHRKKVIPDKKVEDNVESEDPFGWEQKDPNEGKPDGPKWEDIGEYEDRPPEDYSTDSIEDIIQPRIRQKRFIESRVYHVPLEFLSNAKPIEVKVQGDNHI